MTINASPKCPNCGSLMSLKQAFRGPYSGHKFWGCDDFPRCRGLINLVDQDDLPEENDLDTESTSDANSEVPLVPVINGDAFVSIDEAYGDVIGEYVSSSEVSTKVSTLLDLNLGFDPSIEVNPTVRRPKLVRKCLAMGAENVVKALHDAIKIAREYGFYEEVASLVSMLEDDIDFLSGRFFRSATQDRPSQIY
jgi:ssDNA-binding Zn-finger/Zn-ribbon topoisomerase 1